MKSPQIRITAGTAVVSFLLGIAAAPSIRKSETAAVSATQTTKSKERHSSETMSCDPTPASRTRTGIRDEKKKPTEPRISIPLKIIAEVLKEQHGLSGFKYMSYRMEKSLPLLGVSDQEKQEVLALLKQAESEIYAAEKQQLKVIQSDDTQIRLDNSSMGPASNAIAERIQNGIRSTLSTDLAEILISSVKWDEFYPTDAKSYPTLNITRSTSGKMMAWAHESSGGTGHQVDLKFADDGTPIPADEVFPDDRWKPFLKGLTLLPQNEK